VQALVEAQADVMKSMSAHRGFYRNAAPPPMLPPPAELPRRERAPEPEDDDSDEDEEAHAPPAAQPDWVETVKPLVAIVTQQIVTTVMGMKSGGGAGGGSSLKDMLDWRQPAKRKAAAEQAALEAGEGDPGVPAVPAPSIEEQLADPATNRHVFTVLAMLTPEERTVAGKLAAELSPAEQAAWFKELSRLSVEDAAKKVREIVASVIKKPAA
jgi:hypothetical protein